MAESPLNTELTMLGNARRVTCVQHRPDTTKQLFLSDVVRHLFFPKWELGFKKTKKQPNNNAHVYIVVDSAVYT